MRGKKGCIVLAICMVISIVGCSGTKNAVSVEKTAEPSLKQTVVSTVPEIEISDEQEIELKLYLPDENAEYLIYNLVNTDGTPEDIIDDLVEAGALPSGTEVNYFTLYDNGEHIELDDEVAAMSENLTAEIDLTTPFADAVEHTGTAGESMYMGSLVNTFIEYYNLQSLKVTSNGEIIETGHTIYDQPITFYEDLISQ